MVITVLVGIFGGTSIASAEVDDNFCCRPKIRLSITPQAYDPIFRFTAVVRLPRKGWTHLGNMLVTPLYNGEPILEGDKGAVREASIPLWYYSNPPCGTAIGAWDWEWPMEWFEGANAVRFHFIKVRGGPQVGDIHMLDETFTLWELPWRGEWPEPELPEGWLGIEFTPAPDEGHPAQGKFIKVERWQEDLGKFVHWDEAGMMASEPTRVALPTAEKVRLVVMRGYTPTTAQFSLDAGDTWTNKTNAYEVELLDPVTEIMVR
jgi:hypothetical protein